MPVRFVFMILTFLVAVAPAHASVFYSWTPVLNVGNAYGLLEITDAAYASGQVHWLINNAHPDPGTPTPVGPVISFDFADFGNTLGSTGIFIGTFSFDFQIVGNELVGSIDANNTGNEVHMTSTTLDPTVWEIYNANTDGPGNCQFGVCTGDTGRWVLSSVPTNVPEPVSGALLLSGLAAVSIIRRRRNREC
jgi:hypothetical protein